MSGEARSVVVTGAARGIGTATVHTLAAAGWHVVAVDRDAAALAALPAPPGAGVSRLDRLTGDITDPATHDEAARRAARLGPLRGWVNNAAVEHGAPAASLDEERVRRELEVNVLGTMWGCAAAVRAMVDGGSIVSLASIHAQRGFPGAFGYAATKGAVVALTRQLAVEYGPRGIRANTVSPGAIRTRLCEQEWAAAPDPAAAQAADEGLHVMHRMGEPSEVADVIAFLLSEAASLITGQDLVADGGATARPPSVYLG